MIILEKYSTFFVQYKKFAIFNIVVDILVYP